MFAVKNWPRIAAIIVIVCALAVAGCGKQSEPTKAQGDPKAGPTTTTPTAGKTRNLDGKYVLTESQMFGEKQSAAEIAKGPEEERTFVIKGSTISDLFGRKGKSQSIKLNASKTPHEIDVFEPEDGGELKAVRGIYKLEGDKLTIALGGEKPEDRPQNFDFGGRAFILVLVKLK